MGCGFKSYPGAFAIALSDITLHGLGPFFWSLVGGAGVSLLLERDGWRRLRAEAIGEAREGRGAAPAD